MLTYVVLSIFVFGWVSAYSFSFHEYIRAVVAGLMGLAGSVVVIEQLAKLIGGRRGPGGL